MGGTAEESGTEGVKEVLVMEVCWGVLWPAAEGVEEAKEKPSKASSKENAVSPLGTRACWEAASRDDRLLEVEVEVEVGW